jgi:crotonobetaine/carnitine-CoA ligase
VIVPRPGFDPRDLPAFLTGRIPAFMIPRFVEMRTEIPKTATQKVQRHLLQDHPGDVVDLGRHKADTPATPPMLPTA